MPHKDMRDFLRDFFNPPQLMKPKSSKKKIYKKRKKRTGPTPIQLQVGSLALLMYSGLRGPWETADFIVERV